MPEYPLPWETLGQEYATNLATPVDIMVDASNGASDYGNYTVLSVCVCVYLPVCLSACVSVCLSACLSTCDVARSLFLHQTVDKSVDRKRREGDERDRDDKF